MITYVINTSQSRTLSNNQLFDLTGYNKIRWLNCSLSDVTQCAQHIFEQQNVLGADKFRIAVLVDFFEFDRIRVPFGRINYHYDEGVDLSLYLPYIEVFLFDNLIKYLENRALYTSDFEVYYVQSSKLERYEFIDNAKEQLSMILSGGEVWEKPIESCPQIITDNIRDDSQSEDAEELLEIEEPKESFTEVNDLVYYKTFNLYCTKNMSLSYSLADYPYGVEGMTFDQFITSFNERASQKSSIRRHYYVSNFGGGKAHVAFDTLSLSLYLIRMYEREEMLERDGEFEIPHIDPNTLKQVLETAWIKINVACEIAKNNNTAYFSLADNISVDFEGLHNNGSKMEAVYELYKAKVKKLSPEELYRRICHYYNRTPEEVAADNREEFNGIMAEYLKQRDDTREIDVEMELAEKMQENQLITTMQFPSEEEYLNIVNQKEAEISQRFEKALSAEYIDMDYSEEKQQADKAYDKYLQLKACLHRSIIGDIIFMVIALTAFLLPYGVLQLSSYTMTTYNIIMLLLNTVALFGGLFVLAVIIQIVTFSWKFSKVKAVLRGCYRDSYIKDRQSMAQIRVRYREDLLYIERTRYEIRQLKYLYEANRAKEVNVKRHRDTLKMVNNHLSSILNSLDVKPVPDPNETVSGEFDLTKPIRANENKVYRVFSIETIEKLFDTKGGGF